MQSHIRTDYISGNHFKVAVQLQAVISSYLFVCVCVYQVSSPLSGKHQISVGLSVLCLVLEFSSS